ncbi:MAG: PAS domain-containing protein [Deltaproteobacteria bacterium]|nr:PAS domain-containing protein [Deltaproteobacteria bacterium]
MLTTDQSGKIVMMNDLAKSLLGYEPGEYQGAFFDLLVSPEDEKGKPLSPDQRPVAAALARRKSVMRRAHFYRKDERKLPVSVTASPVLMNGEIIGTIETFRDITKEMELDQMKDEFVSVTSHELRTPLTVIREGVSLVLDGLLGAVTDRQKKFLSVTLKDIDRLKRIIDDLLDVSKIEAGKVQLKKEKVDLISLAKGVADSFQSRAQSKGLEIKTEFFTQSLEMELDQDKIIQVFTNLIGNAFKFTEKGHVEISVRENGNFAECGVTDTGPGMSPDDLPILFSKYKQLGQKKVAKEKGTGLGLVISKEIVKLHGGDIWAESELGKGTRFAFTLSKGPRRQNTGQDKDVTAIGVRPT